MTRAQTARAKQDKVAPRAGTLRPRSTLVRPRRMLRKMPSLVTGLKRLLHAALALGFGVIAYASVLVLALTRNLLEGEVRLYIVFGVWATLVWRTLTRLGKSAGSFDRMGQVELGLLFTASTASVVAMLGGYSGPMYPLFFALVAYFAVFLRWFDAGLLFLAMLGLEAAVTFTGYAGERALIMRFASHVTFDAFFAVLYAVFMRSEVAQHRQAVRSRVQDEIDRMLQDARDYRLIGAVHDQDGAQAERRMVGSISAVREALFNLLAVGEKALSPRNLAVYVVDSAGTNVSLKEVRGFGEDLARGPIGAREGIFGGIFAKNAPVVLTRLSRYRSLSYYGENGAVDRVTDFAGVPILEGEHARGVLLCDRIDSRAFETQDVALLEALAKEVARTLEVERVFGQMDAERKSRDKFFRASVAFSSTRTIDDVAGAAMQSASNLCEPALLALTSIDRDEHVLRASRGPLSEKCPAATALKDPSALVNTALKTKTSLPLPGVPIGDTTVFGKSLPLTGLSAVRVFPLFAQSEPIGSWVVGLGRGLFPAEVESMLASLSQQVATSLMNARMNEAMERMATTDALTGLNNRRFFTQLFGERLELAERYGRKLSVILCDIDHFKSVNDTYGHPTGDVVLKAISKVLAGSARKADVVGRLGGEEFAVVMSETDGVGAKLQAERIRERVMKEIIAHEHGKLSVTLSLGIATFPDDAKTEEHLISRADEALYRAKHGGRNRSVAYSGGGK